MSPHEEWQGKVLNENPCIVVGALNQILMRGDKGECEEWVIKFSRKYAHVNIYKLIPSTV
jgi:hypothetical protein